MNPEALLVSFYIYKANGQIPNLILLPRNYLFPQSLRTVHSLPEATTDPALFPDVCMCGKIYSLTNGNLRLCCPHCYATYSRTRWQRCNILAMQQRAFQRMFTIDPTLLHLYMAAAIHLDSRRQHESTSQHIL